MKTRRKEETDKDKDGHRETETDKDRYRKRQIDREWKARDRQKASESLTVSSLPAFMPSSLLSSPGKTAGRPNARLGKDSDNEFCL